MELDLNSQPKEYRFEQEILTYRHLLKVIAYLVIPLAAALMIFVIMQRRYGSIIILVVILGLNISVLAVERTQKPSKTKSRINGYLFKSQVVAMIFFLFYEIIVEGYWEMVPWTGVVCYLSFVIIGVRAGTIVSGMLGVVLLVFYRYTATPESIPMNTLMFRFFPSFFLLIAFFICFEIIRNDYRRRLADTNLTLMGSKEKYRRLYEKLKGEVSDRKHAEQELRASEERFRLIAENVVDIIWITDMNLKFSYVSPSVLRQRGYTVEESLTQALDQVVIPNDLDMVIKLYSERLAMIESGDERGLEPVEFEISQPCKDGSVIRTSNHARLLTGPDGKLIGVLGITRDITERRKTEEKQARSKKMESLGLLAGGVAHDLNNILSGIVSYPELLLLDLPVDSKLRLPIETIQASGIRAAAIVQDLLTVARGVAVTKEALNLNTLIQDYLRSPEYARLQQKHPAVTFKNRLGDDLMAITGSPVHLRKIIMNLVSNAAEALPGGGCVRITTENRYLDQPLTGYQDLEIGEYAVLSVYDNGPGIKAEHLERVFEPFYTTKAMGRSGTGLGLAVVWNAVKDHRGYIDLSSTANETRFELYFPITREEIAVLKQSLPIEEYRGKGERILVVDDVRSQREISCRMLESLGYDAISVAGGEKAVTYLQNTCVDLVLLDMIMAPGINGRQTYEKILQIHPRQKAVIVSGFAKTEEVQKTQALGAGEFLRKPLTLEQLGLSIKGELTR